jgi:hypothetical protein
MNLRYVNLHRVLILLVLVAASSAASGARAQCAGYGGGWGAWDVGRLYGVLSQNVPHFAAFPPVYYSYPVPRTYGYSPFAYPPGVMTPEIEIAEPLAVTNPYFRESGETAPAAAKVDQTAATATPQPRLIVNPYVEHPAPALATR